MTDFSKNVGNVFLLVTVLFLSACNGSNGKNEEAAPTPGVSAASSADSDTDNTAEVAEDFQALITFLSGEVLLSRSGVDSVPEIGSVVKVGDELKTGDDGYVELQIGKIGALRIQAESSYRLDTAELKEDSEQVSGFLGAGTIIAKIRHLTNRDKFEVNVPGAVCAVRGTEFLVRTSKEDSSITIAVADGAVSVVPPSMAEAGNKTEPEKEALSSIRPLMPLVTADNEMVIETDTLDKMEQVIVAYQEVSREADDSDGDTGQKQLESAIREIVSEEPLPVPVAIGADNAEILEAETPEIMEISYKSEEKESAPLPDLVSISVTVNPPESRIFINNRPAGLGTASMAFPKDSKVTVVAVSPDGRRQEKIVTAGIDSRVDFSFEEPDNAEVSSSENAEIIPAAAAVKDSPAPNSPVETSSTSEPVPPAAAVSQKVEFQLSSEPADASVFINGKLSGHGSGSYSGNSGDQLSIKVSRPGYEEVSRSLTLGSSGQSLNVRLVPKPIVNKVQISNPPAVGSLVSDGTVTVGATRGGSVYAVDSSGRILWTRATNNRDGENVTPVISGNRVIVIGNTELVIISISDGSIVARRELSGDQVDLFGRRVLAWNKYLVLPSDSALIYLNSNNGVDSGKVNDNINIPGGSRMTPALWNNQIVLADQRGVLLFIDPVSKTITRSLPTSSTQSIGQALSINGNVGVFSGRRGEVTAVNLQKNEILWEHKLAEGSSVRVHSDVLIHNNGVYVYGSNVLYALNLNSGTILFSPVQGVSAPPQIVNGTLYLCRDDGTITLHNPGSGVQIGKFELGEVSTVRPAGSGPFVVAAGRENVFLLDPRSMTE